METGSTQTQSLMPIETPAAEQRAPLRFRAWLDWPRNAIAAAAVIIVVLALALGLGWTSFVALAPLLFILPCAAMMAMCMRHSDKSQ